MATDYDAISEEYKRSKLTPWRSEVETYTLFELAGDLTGLSVLDLACGEGFHTRSLKHRGAGRVVGVDLSHGMIELAEQEEAQRPLGIEFVAGDVRGLDLGEQFDLVFAAWLLNYASNARELLEMCEAIARHLKPGCRFVTVNNNPDYSGDDDTMRKYQFTRQAPDPVDGAETGWTFYLDDGPFSITNYYLSRATHEQAMADAGLREVTWYRPRLSPEGLAADGAEFWADLLECQPMAFIECRR